MLGRAERGAHVRVARGDLIAGLFRDRPRARVLDLLRGFEALLSGGRNGASGAGGGGGRRRRGRRRGGGARTAACAESGRDDEEQDEERRAMKDHVPIIAQAAADWSTARRRLRWIGMGARASTRSPLRARRSTSPTTAGRSTPKSKPWRLNPSRAGSTLMSLTVSSIARSNARHAIASRCAGQWWREAWRRGGGGTG